MTNVDRYDTAATLDTVFKFLWNSQLHSRVKRIQTYQNIFKRFFLHKITYYQRTSIYGQSSYIEILWYYGHLTPMIYSTLCVLNASDSICICV